MESKTQEWIDAQKLRIKEVFELFDRDKTDAIMQEEIGTVMRALGAYPSERNLTVDILPNLADDENSGFVTYERFERKMLHVLANREYEPDTIDVLLQAFRTIDTNNDGFIPADELETLLTSRGIEFRPKEIESFLTVAKDPDTGNVYYEVRGVRNALDASSHAHTHSLTTSFVPFFCAQDYCALLIQAQQR